jgi:hypothetical protein
MRIDYFQQKQVSWSDISFPDFNLAKDVAREAVSAGLAERVEIRGDDGRLQYHWPRVTRRA